MAHVEQPPSAPEVKQAHGDMASLLLSPSPCTGEQQMAQPPPYTPSPPAYTLDPSFNPQSSPSEPHHPWEPDPAPSYQSTTEGQLVVEGCGIQVTTFENKSIRRAFIRKVFCMVTLQLLFTFSVVCVFTFSSTVRDYVHTNIWIMISSYAVFTVVSLCLLLCRSFSRFHPWNLIGLGLVTLSLSYMVGTVASHFNTPAVIIAMGSTLVTVFAIIIFSAQFLVVDCQLVMGREKYSLSPEEYVYGALVIYLDVMYIFLYILMMFGGGSKQ